MTAAEAAAKAEKALAGDSADTVVPNTAVSTKRKAMLFINTKAGSNSDCTAALKQAVDLLTAHGFDIDVRDQMKSSHFSEDARAAAKAGCPLVIAAGGDGTVEMIAANLIGTQTVLGIIPLGTYNNVAHVLGIPTELAEACALIVDGPVRPIDIGLARVDGSEERHLFFEMATIGLGAALMPVGEATKDKQWAEVAKALPQAVDMTLAKSTVVLDGVAPGLESSSMLLTVCNTPRAAAAYPMAPEARMDDGLLDVTVYPGMEQAALLIHFAGLAHGLPAPEVELQRYQAQEIQINTEPKLPVSADSKVIGTTPASFTLLPEMLLVIAGNGPGLSHPVDFDRVAAASENGRREAAIRELSEPSETPSGLAAVTAPVIAFIEEKILGKSPSE